MVFRQTVAIVALSTFAACLYGVLHDLVTAHVCLQYFTEFHPDLGIAPDPIAQALAWGVIATWWVGLPLGGVVAFANLFGSRPHLSTRQLVKPISVLLIVMAICAAAAGGIGYLVGEPITSMVFPEGQHYGSEFGRRFGAVLFTHNASYFSGIFGGIALAVWVWVKRGRFSVPPIMAERRL